MFKEKQRVFVYLSREYDASISTIVGKQLGMDSRHVVMLDPRISGLDQYEWDALDAYLIRCVIGLVDYLHHDYIHLKQTLDEYCSQCHYFVTSSKASFLEPLMLMDRVNLVFV